MFSSRGSSKKRESDGLSASSGASKNSEAKGRTPSFSLSRLLPLRRRSKSRLSLDSELSRSDNGACSSPFPGRGGGSRNSPPLFLSSVVHLGNSSSSVAVHSVKENEETQTFSGSLASPSSTDYSNSKEGHLETSLSDLGALEEDRTEIIECPVCLVEKPKTCFLEISTCHHRCCSQCLKEYFKVEIMESRIAIACPECSERFHPNDIEAIVQDPSLMHKYQDFMLRRVLVMDSDTRWCPAPDCGYAVIATGCAGCPKLKCERDGCNTYFCYHCKQYWHPNQTCDAARAERTSKLRSIHTRSASVSYSQESGHQNEIKPCPRCSAFIAKMDDGSCNHMTCAVCGAGFCWLCMQEISDLHYLSPSGCTFWGDKPWGRKKKILWQLGTLVGAPVGITLVAGIAVPAMIIGIPVWVGRKIHIRYDKASKHKRNLYITGGVAASILAAPVIAGLAVGVGVPILLTLVYGVVPVSLCRSGGCGVTTTNTGGVRFDFDEENETNQQGPYSITGDNQSVVTANMGNPSIAPSIGDASLGMTNSLSASGSHMERAGVLRDDSDRDSSSHRAIAGNSINGSLCSATYSAQHHNFSRLEVRADVSEATGQCERSSVGGESYNVSLTDDASTRALAGSIISPKDKDGVSLCSRHFDVYPEEPGKEVEDSGCGETRNERGSSSCPNSPHLRKASSPAPSEEARSGRGKKCTRFMDQVSEIEFKGDCASLVSVVSTASVLSSTSGCSSVLPSCDMMVAVTTSSAVIGSGMCSNLSLPVNPSEEDEEEEERDCHVDSLASCESLLSEGRAGSIRRSVSLGNACRVKAESTSVLLDGAESRLCEMGGARRKSDSTYRNDLSSVNRSFMGSHKKGGVVGRDKEHRSQPGNLSDISELKGMSVLHTGGCSDLLAVMDTSCESVSLDHSSRAKSRLISTSVSSSSTSDSSLSRTSIGSDSVMTPYSTLPEIEQPLSHRDVIVDCTSPRSKEKHCSAEQCPVKIWSCPDTNKEVKMSEPSATITLSKCSQNNHSTNFCQVLSQAQTVAMPTVERLPSSMTNLRVSPTSSPLLEHKEIAKSSPVLQRL